MSCRSSLKGLYIARHDRLVDLIVAQTPRTEDEQIHKQTTVCFEWFHSSADTFSGLANPLDIFTISRNDKNVILFDISCAF